MQVGEVHGESLFCYISFRDRYDLYYSFYAIWTAAQDGTHRPSPLPGAEKSPAMILVAFRSRLRPESTESYAAMAQEIAPLALQVPGYVAHKAYTAPDGERVTLVEYETEDAVKLWARDAQHATAKRAGRTEFFSWYRVQVCQVLRDRSHDIADARPAAPAHPVISRYY
jgi:heme-degrading monooxygenase HmoA